MEKIKLGKSGLVVTRPAFGALPIQRAPRDEAVKILHRALDAGINFFDTARFYTDSEKKLGTAFKGLRQNLILASKSFGPDRAGIEADLKVSLSELGTDYLDLYQFHNPATVPRPGDGTGRYELLAELKKKGVIRSIGLTNHSLALAGQAVESGLFDTLQFPFSLISTAEEQNLAEACRKADMGFIAMKGLSGGLIDDIPAAVAFMGRFDNVVPIWGVQSMDELDEFLELAQAPPAWDAGMAARARAAKEALGSQFCRGCGYCLPCPQNIDIPNLARMARLLRRSPWQGYTGKDWMDKMERGAGCINCGACSSRCPYKLDTPALIASNVDDYKQFMREMGVRLPF
ncbi:MAG: aldo/keto reductase [Deltaproteobacteria bacterium]|jgi:aryl-alcohol dehydrogenase-like predicted oxidoreductase|nr:aldo/keto reductase [Deltaproteobacteria bacterium]